MPERLTETSNTIAISPRHEVEYPDGTAFLYDLNSRLRMNGGRELPPEALDKLVWTADTLLIVPNHRKLVSCLAAGATDTLSSIATKVADTQSRELLPYVPLEQIATSDEQIDHVGLLAESEFVFVEGSEIRFTADGKRIVTILRSVRPGIREAFYHDLQQELPVSPKAVANDSLRTHIRQLAILGGEDKAIIALSDAIDAGSIHWWDPEWRIGAKCKGTVTAPEEDIFFPEKDNRAQATQEALKICRGCPVKRLCRDFALAYEAQYSKELPGMGIYGGTTGKQRRTLLNANPGLVAQLKLQWSQNAKLLTASEAKRLAKLRQEAERAAEDATEQSPLEDKSS